MQVTIKTVSTKLTQSILKQIQEASAQEMLYSLENGTVLGYINNAGPQKQRLFLITVEDNYRVIVNREWKLSGEKDLLASIPGKGLWRKKFVNQAAALDFLHNFARIKAITLNAQISV